MRSPAEMSHFNHLLNMWVMGGVGIWVALAWWCWHTRHRRRPSLAAALALMVALIATVLWTMQFIGHNSGNALTLGVPWTAIIGAVVGSGMGVIPLMIPTYFSRYYTDGMCHHQKYGQECALPKNHSGIHKP